MERGLFESLPGASAPSNDQEKDASTEQTILGQLSVLQEGAWLYAKE